eukprot:12285778-Alexandrium_andersonii.AAC.1
MKEVHKSAAMSERQPRRHKRMPGTALRSKTKSPARAKGGRSQSAGAARPPDSTAKSASRRRAAKQ